jgi:hypothetical protein
MIRTWGTCFDLASKLALNVVPQRGNILNIYLRRGVTVLQVLLDLDRTRRDKTYLFCFGCPSPLCCMYKSRQGSAFLKSSQTVPNVISRIQHELFQLPTSLACQRAAQTYTNGLYHLSSTQTQGQ